MPGLLTEPLPGLAEILPVLGVETNLVAVLAGAAAGGLLAIVFSNSGSMFEWFKGAASKNLPSIVVPAMKTHIPEIGAPIGLPYIPGLTKER